MCFVRGESERLGLFTGVKVTHGETDTGKVAPEGFERGIKTLRTASKRIFLPLTVPLSDTLRTGNICSFLSGQNNRAYLAWHQE